MDLNEFRAELTRKRVDESQRQTELPRDVVLCTTKVSSVVHNFLNEMGLVGSRSEVATKANPELVIATESLSPMSATKAINQIETMVNVIASKSPVETRYSMMDAVGTTIGHMAGKSNRAVWQTMNRANITPATGKTTIGVESFLPASIASAVLGGGGQLSTESFGSDIDKVTPDLKQSVTVGIMKFFNSITTKMFPRKLLSDPMISFIIDEVTVYKTDDTTEVPMIELNRDPEVVSANLTRVVALVANDATNTYLTEDEYIKPGVTAKLMELSLDASKPAYASANRTDILADNVMFEKVVCSFTIGAATETFEFSIPTGNSRLHRVVDGSAYLRTANIQFTGLLKNNTTQKNGTVTTIFGGINAADGLLVSISVSPTINLKNTEALWTGTILGINAVNLTDASVDPVAATTTLLGTIAASTLVAAKYDAKFSEENLRKTNIGAEVISDVKAFDIPTGKNYFIDYAYKQQYDTDQGTAQLINLINYGIDSRTLNLINSTLNEIHDLWINHVPTGKPFKPGQNYVSGTKIKPYAYSGTFDCSDYQNMKELERIQDIHAASRIKLLGIINKINAKSYIKEQLTGGNVTYRVVSDPEFLGNVLGVAYMHDRIKQFTSTPAPGTVDAILTLDNNATIEVVTVPFDSMKEKIVGIPYFETPESIFNFAINADMGSVVAHYSSDAQGLKWRLFTNARELPIVLNPSGFVMNVTHMPTEMNL